MHKLPLRMINQGKVRDVYEVDDQRLLLVATDRVSAFDRIMNETIQDKGVVLTQLSAWWFGQLEGIVSHHMISADVDEIICLVPQLVPHRAEIAGRAMLCRKADPFPVECVMRNFLAGSAWKEYARTGAFLDADLPSDLMENQQLPEAIFSPAAKSKFGHDENITISEMTKKLGEDDTETIEGLARKIFAFGQQTASDRGIDLADTKFEFGRAPDGEIILIDEVFTPDSSRFWLKAEADLDAARQGFDKQPLRDYLLKEQSAASWTADTPMPVLPQAVLENMSQRYRAIFKMLTQEDLQTSW